MILRRGRRFLALLLWIATAASAQEPALQTWCLDHGRLEMTAGATDAPLAVGSIQKPFVAKAWAQAHADQPSPRYTCAGGDTCWLKKGHGNVGLATALARSCNAYFRQMAAATPIKELTESLHEAGFAPAPSNPDEAIGLAAPHLLRIPPSQLLEAYRALLREPWPQDETIRQEVLRGLRESARSGTAGGLGTWGFWAKTGTVPLDGSHTVGFALALDEGDLAMLARLRPGTGSQAAQALAAPLAVRRPGTPVPSKAKDAVTVRLFDLLPATVFTVRNTGASPIPDGRGFLGAGSGRALRPGDRVGPGPLEFHCEARGIRRRVEGQLQVAGGRLLVTLTRRAYVEGVLAAELPSGSPELRVELGAAVLRFLARGRRHVDADVCDSTHCAWFVGQGPRLDWKDSAHAQEEASVLEPLSDGDWSRMQALANKPGPAFWSAHCGGTPLSTQRVWGWGEATAEHCPRHSGTSTSWTRNWPPQALEQAFGASIEAIFMEPSSGVWKLTVIRDGLRSSYTFDEAHRRIAGVLGWDALPSPADRLERSVTGAVRLFGVGQGHRVGLCLGK
jgi:hypothetical protein